MPLILAVVLLILVLLLRAVTAPLLLIGTVVLSFGAAMGLSALVFRHVFGFAGADPSLPLFVFVFLVALGIDYNIFLMTRVHEESKEVGTWRGALAGLAATGGVITSAGLVLAGTFAVLATMPVVAFAEVGFAVALGVLLDTLIVVGARDGTQPRPQGTHVVAEPPRPQGRRIGGRCGRGRAGEGGAGPRARADPLTPSRPRRSALPLSQLSGIRLLVWVAESLAVQRTPSLSARTSESRRSRRSPVRCGRRP